MTRIAVCDDQPEIGLLLQRQLDRLAADGKIMIETETFSDSRSFCATLKDGRYYDLVFLDIELGGRPNGLELCRRMRDGCCANPYAPVIFISGKEGYEKELLRFYPLYFLPKPFEYQELFDIVSTALKLETVNRAVFEYNVNHEYKRMPIRDILYFESRGRRIGLIFPAGTDSFYGKLDSIQEELKNTSFLRIHKSYLINTDHVKAIRFDSMILWNGAVLPISQSKQRIIRQTLADMKDE